MKKIFRLILFFALATTSCGKKGTLKYPEPDNRVRYENIVDEE